MSSARGEAAIAEHQSLLDADPYRLESYQALRKLYSDARARDEAGCVTSTLAFVERAEGGRAPRSRHRALIRPTSCLDDERWLRDLAHPSQDLVVSKIFQTIWPAILALRGKTDKDAQLSPRYQVDPTTHTSVLARTFGFVAETFGVRTPRLFLRPDVQGGITHLPVYPLGSLCGATLLTGFAQQDLTFIVGRHLADYRGEHYIRTLVPSFTELKTVLMAALRIADFVPGDPKVDAVANEIRPKLQPMQIDVLHLLGRRFVDSGGRADMTTWLQGVELTACRAGFLVSGDLDTAARMIAALGASGPADLTVAEKVKSLVRFSVSPEHFRLRKALGIQSRFG